MTLLQCVKNRCTVILNTIHNSFSHTEKKVINPKRLCFFLKHLTLFLYFFTENHHSSAIKIVHP